MRTDYGREFLRLECRAVGNALGFFVLRGRYRRFVKLYLR